MNENDGYATAYNNGSLITNEENMVDALNVFFHFFILFLWVTCKTGDHLTKVLDDNWQTSSKTNKSKRISFEKKNYAFTTCDKYTTFSFFFSFMVIQLFYSKKKRDIKVINFEKIDR